MPAQQPTARHREVALHHANLIQQQKTVRHTIVEALEELLDFPRGDHPNVDRPYASDVGRFNKLIHFFNPSDLDDLFTERKCANRCAYVFCPKPSPVIASNRGTLDWGRSNALGRIVKRDDRWCSKECTLRSMYIKVQLSETPAWQRSAQDKVEIELLTDREKDGLLDSLSRLSVKESDTERIENMMRDLAIERGRENGDTSIKAVSTATVNERIVTQVAEAPIPATTGDQGATSIEGYVPKTGNVKKQDEEEDDDWEL